MFFEQTNFNQTATWFRGKPKSAAAKSEPVREKFTPQTILQRIAAGDNAAVQECMNKYSGLVWSLARRMCQNTADAEDAVQEIFIEIWRSAERFDESRASETTFIAMIARRRLIDRLRKSTRRPDINSLEDTLYEPSSEAAGENIMTSLEAREAARVLKDLRPEQQKAIYLSIVQGCSHQEIADVLDMPLGTVKTHIRRGLIETREILGLDGSNGQLEVSA